MIIVGTVVVLAIFLVIGWAIATEMFQQRAWRKRAEEGDPEMVRALLDEAFATWQRARPPRGLPFAQPADDIRRQSPSRSPRRPLGASQSVTGAEVAPSDIALTLP